MNWSYCTNPKLALRTSTFESSLWRILLKRGWKSTWRTCLDTCAPFPSDFFFLSCPLILSFIPRLHNFTLERWMPVCLLRATIDLCRGTEAQQQHAHGRRPGRLCEPVQSIQFKTCTIYTFSLVMFFKKKLGGNFLQNSPAFSSELTRDTQAAVQSAMPTHL